jgi:hypothetical protein
MLRKLLLILVRKNLFKTRKLDSKKFRVFFYFSNSVLSQSLASSLVLSLQLRAGSMGFKADSDSDSAFYLSADPDPDFGHP